MKLIKLLSLLFVITGFTLLSNPSAHAQVNGNGGNVGIGAMLGEPTGISVKIWNNSNNAFDAGVAWSFGDNDALHLHADYLLHKWFSDIDQGALAFYYGIGGRMAFSDPDSEIGIRVPFGLNYIIPDSQIDLFVEAVPILNLAPDTDFDGNGAVGIRYYF